MPPFASGMQKPNHELDTEKDCAGAHLGIPAPDIATNPGCLPLRTYLFAIRGRGGAQVWPV